MSHPDGDTELEELVPHIDMEEVVDDAIEDMKQLADQYEGEDIGHKAGRALDALIWLRHSE